MSDVDSQFRQWSATESSNKPTGATPIGTGLSGNLRQIQASVRKYLASPGSTIVSAATVDLSNADGRQIPISGTSTVVGLGSESAGIEYLLTTIGAVPFKNSSALALPGAVDFTSTAGDYLLAVSKGAGNWVIPWRTNFAAGTIPFNDTVSLLKGSTGAQLYFDVHSNVTAGQSVMMAIPSASGILATTTETNGRPLLPAYHIQGFGMTSGTTTYDIADGQAIDSTNVINILGNSMAGKSQSNWSAGGSAGGKLQSSAMANATWYNWFALRKDLDGSVDYGFDASVVPTMPSGYTYFRRIGSRKTQAASTNWETLVQRGDLVLWSTPPALDVSSATPSVANRTLTTVNTPPSVRTEWVGNVIATATAGNNATFILTDPALTDIAVSGGLAANLPDVILSNTTSNTLATGGTARCWTNTSNQIGIRGVSTAANYSVQTRGFVDPRGKPL